MTRPVNKESAAKKEGREPKYTPSDFEPKTNDQKYLAGGRTPAERASAYRKSTRTKSGSLKRVGLSEQRLGKLQEEDRNLHSLLQRGNVKEVTRKFHAAHGASSPSMRQESMTMAAPAKAPAGKTVDPVAESRTRRAARTVKAAEKTVRTKPTAQQFFARAKEDVSQAKRESRAKAKENLTGLVHNDANIQVSRHGPKAPLTDHLHPAEFAGKHHAPASTSSSMKNAKGAARSPGAHSSYEGRHRGSYNESHDVTRTALSGSISYGRHTKPGANTAYSSSVAKIRGPFEPGQKNWFASRGQ